jgi:hypothetical protein
MMTEERLQWFKTLVAVHEPELGELFQEIDRLRSAPAQEAGRCTRCGASMKCESRGLSTAEGSALTQPPRQSIASDEIPYRGPFVFSAFGSGVAPAQTALYRQTILNQAKTSDKLRAELEEGHEHYAEILAKYCAANERAERLQAQLATAENARDIEIAFRHSAEAQLAQVREALATVRKSATQHSQYDSWLAGICDEVLSSTTASTDWLSRKLAEAKQEAPDWMAEHRAYFSYCGPPNVQLHFHGNGYRGEDNYCSKVCPSPLEALRDAMEGQKVFADNARAAALRPAGEPVPESGAAAE